jgi:hypothetical protein
MEMPDFENYRYIVIEDGNPESFSAYWIERKGRLVQASSNEVEALGPHALEKVELPEAIGLNYQGRYSLAVYRVSKRTD